MLNRNCAVVSCRNCSNRWKEREKKDCSKHEVLSLGSCTCSRRFTLHRFPSKLLNLEKREIWIQEMRGIYSKNAAWAPGKTDMVCSGLGSGRARGL